jgi:hypothetical protein
MKSYRQWIEAVKEIIKRARLEDRSVPDRRNSQADSTCLLTKNTRRFNVRNMLLILSPTPWLSPRSTNRPRLQH